jgi:hypothetical protein
MPRLRITPDRRDQPDHVAGIDDADLDLVSRPLGADGAVHRTHSLHVAADVSVGVLLTELVVDAAEAPATA